MASLEASPSASPVGSPASPSAGPAARNGLLVAAGGSLQILDAGGILGAFGDRPDPVLDVSAGGGAVLIIDAGFLAWLGTGERPDHVAWRRFALPTDGQAQRPMLALGPDGATIAVATGELQGRTFELILIDVASGEARSIPVDHGLNGPPVWLGHRSIAINVLGHDQHAGFVEVDTATGVVSDLPATGFSIAASADGSTIALDDSASGEALVGMRTNLGAGGTAGLTRIPSPVGFAVDDVALSDEGTRLAIVLRSDTATSLEVVELVDGAWRRHAPLTLDADAVLSIAWLG